MKHLSLTAERRPHRGAFIPLKFASVSCYQAGCNATPALRCFPFKINTRWPREQEGVLLPSNADNRRIIREKRWAGTWLAAVSILLKKIATKLSAPGCAGNLSENVYQNIQHRVFICWFWRSWRWLSWNQSFHEEESSCTVTIAAYHWQLISARLKTAVQKHLVNYLLMYSWCSTSYCWSLMRNVS